MGRLLGDKGVREFVEAANIVRQSNPNARFQLLWAVAAENRTAITRAELEGCVRRGTVEYLGTLDDERPALAQANAAVLPSYPEGLPRSLLEASAMARPLIATDVPGNRTLVEDGYNGLLCDVRSAPSLADAMSRFLALAPARRQEMGENAREKVVRGFSEEKVIGAYISLVGNLTRSGMQ